MFNTEMYLSTFVYIMLMLAIFFISLQTLIREKIKEKKSYYCRFTILIFLGIVYNIIEGLLPDKKLDLSLKNQNIIAWNIGLLIAIYYFYFLKKEYDILKIKYINITQIVIITLSLFTFLFVIPYNITDELEVSRRIYLSLIIMILMLILFFYIKKVKINSFKINNLNVLIAFLALISFPIIIFTVGDDQFLEHTFFSIGFFSLSVNFFIYRNKRSSLQDKKLSSREKQIFEEFKLNPNAKYKDIGEKFNISEKTVTSHMSRIFKKLDVKNKKSFIKKEN